MPDSAETPFYRPLDIITEGEWDHVLFTTYALSLSFYETQLHKLGLARNGCRDIRIIADADGYQLSLSERQSNRIGNEYRLTPVALPNGVFHPKLIWLAGKELDLILLGSGNLTFGGFGRNVECLNVIRSDTHPEMFSQIGGLLAAWSARPDLTFSETDWLPFWQQRAEERSAVRTLSGGSTPELLHSTTSSIGQQLISRLHGIGKVKEVRSLSPFYDPDGAGIINFTESLGARTLVVGLLPGREERTTFPFGLIRKSSLRITAAEFEAPEDSRTLHAKIFEILMEDGSCFLLTGSVNATRKSLLTSDNVEAAILHHLPKSSDSPFVWKPTTPPASHHTPEFTKAGLGSRIVVSARLTSDNILQGSVLATSNPEGIWQGVLQRMDGCLTELEIAIGAQGTFAVPLKESELFQHSAGLQLSVRLGDREGTGWVSVDGLLLAARRGFLSPAVLIKLLSPDADESEESELLRYLATSAQRHLPAFVAKRNGGGARSVFDQENEGKGERATHIPIELLGSSGFSEKQSITDRKAQEETMLNAFMFRIRNSFLRRNASASDVQEVDESGSDRAAARELKERLQKRKQLITSLRGFHEKLSTLVSELSPGYDKAAALCMWFEVSFPILLRRLNEPEEAEAFLRHWLNEALKEQTADNSPDVFSAHLLAALLTLAAGEIAREPDSIQTKRRLGRTHEQLEHFCEDRNPFEFAEELELLDDGIPPIAAELLQAFPSAPSLSNALELVLVTCTPRQQIKEIRQLYENGTPIPEDLPIFSLEAGQSFLSQIESGRRPPVCELPPTKTFCPHCHLKLRPATLIELSVDRFTTCRNCSKFLLACH